MWKKIITSFSGATNSQFTSVGNKSVHFDHHIRGKAGLGFVHVMWKLEQEARFLLCVSADDFNL